MTDQPQQFGNAGEYVDKAKDYAQQNPDQARSFIDKVEELRRPEDRRQVLRAGRPGRRLGRGPARPAQQHQQPAAAGPGRTGRPRDADPAGADPAVGRPAGAAGVLTGQVRQPA